MIIIGQFKKYRFEKLVTLKNESLPNRSLRKVVTPKAVTSINGKSTNSDKGH